MRKLEDIESCEHEECKEKAVSIVWPRHLDKVVACCEKHEDKVIDEDDPEYWDSCNNCGCRQGVNF